LATDKTIGTGLYLDIDAGAGAPERLTAVLARTPAEAVLIRTPTGRDPSQAAIRQIVAIAQANGAAALVCGEAALAIAVQADGIHLPWSADVEAAYKEARRALGPQMIIGAEAGNTRHDAMVLGESGADYVAFTSARSASGTTSLDIEQLIETIAWWGEVFEVPGVAMAIVEIEDAVALAGAGADFIGFRLPAGEAPATAAERVARLIEALGSIRRTPPQIEARR
jgi:thiamine-phosphate pyrophosphorylase